MNEELQPTENSANSLAQIGQNVGISPLALTDVAYMRYVNSKLRLLFDKTETNEHEIVNLFDKVVDASPVPDKITNNLKKLIAEYELELASRKQYITDDGEQKIIQARKQFDQERFGGADIASTVGYTSSPWLALTAGIFTGGVGAAVVGVAGVLLAARTVAKNEETRKLFDEGSIKKSIEAGTAEQLYQQEEKYKLNLQQANQSHDMELSQAKSFLQDTKNQLLQLRQDLTINRKEMRIFGVSDALVHCTQQNGSNIQSIYEYGGQNLQNLVEGKHNLADLENLVKDATENTVQAILDPKKHGNNLPEILALQAFVCQSVIPNLDFFVMQAQENEADLSAVRTKDYPVLQQLGKGSYSLNIVPENSVKDLTDSVGEAISEINFSDLLIKHTGTHRQRLERAIDKTIEKTNYFSKKYDDFEERIKQNIADIRLNSLKFEEELSIKQKAEQTNESINQRVKELEVIFQAKLNAHGNERWAREAPGMATGTLATALICSPEPVGQAIGHLLMGTVGHGSLSKTFGQYVGDETEKAGHEALVQLLRERKIDDKALEKSVYSIEKSINYLKKETAALEGNKKSITKDAIQEAFIAQSLLLFGRDTLDVLENKIKTQRINNIDELISRFGVESRLSQAIERLGFGFANSNDVVVILAESNSLRGELLPHELALKDFVENNLKPHIGEFYAHASKVDYIYQTNLSGLGTVFHMNGKTIRPDDDMKKALFDDAFGISSQMQELTSFGALAVRNRFGLHAHDHGGEDWLTDSKVRDGKFTGKRIKKRVSVVSPDEMQEHLHVSIASKGIRQSGPEIDNMLVRICGFNYFNHGKVDYTSRANIMVDNHEAPAAYVMTNNVIQGFVERLGFASVDDYQQHVGKNLDSVVTDSFVDFFKELGAMHEANDEMIVRRNNLDAAAKSGNRYGFVMENYAETITHDALSHFGLFLDIYKNNLESKLERVPENERFMLESQLAEIANVAQDLNPEIIKPGSRAARIKAANMNHTLEKTGWRIAG